MDKSRYYLTLLLTMVGVQVYDFLIQKMCLNGLSSFLLSFWCKL